MICLMFACKKETPKIDEEPLKPLIGKSSTVFFLDTFRVYATDLAGNNKRLVFDEDINSGNNYFTAVDYSASSKRLIYAYKPGFNIKQELKSINVDGTDKKIIKTLGNTSVFFNFASSFGGKILYSTTEYTTANTIVTETRLIDENGGNDSKVSWPKPTVAARDGSGYLSISDNYGTTIPTSSIYRVVIKNGVFDEANSFTLPQITGYIRGSALSSDGNTYIYLLARDPTSTQLDVMSVDLSKKGGLTKKVTTYEFPKTGDGAVTSGQSVSLSFANGTTNLILSYGVRTSSGRYANKDDYYFFQLLDTEKGTVASKWKIFNDFGGNHIVD